MNKRTAGVWLLLLAAGLFLSWRYWRAAKAPPVPPTEAAAGPALPVKIRRAWLERIDENLPAVGTLLANESVIIRPEIAGRIEAIRFTEGQRVRTADPLFQINADEHRASLSQIEAQQELDRHSFERIKEMRAKNHTSAQLYDEALSRLKYSNASVEKARVALNKTLIRAPFEGMVGLRRVSVGDYVEEGQALVNVEALNPVKLDFKIPEKYAGQVQPGQSVSLAVDAFPGRAFLGKVYAVDPRLDETSRSIKLRAAIPNPDSLLKPGMFARVELGWSGTREALFVPEEALVMRGSSASVFQVIDGKARFRGITTGIRRKGSVEIVAGLAPGDLVVTDGQMKLRDGAAVVAANPAD